MAKRIDGKVISKQIKDELKEEVAQLKAKRIEGSLAVIQVGNDRHPLCMSIIRKSMRVYWNRLYFLRITGRDNGSRAFRYH